MKISRNVKCLTRTYTKTCHMTWTIYIKIWSICLFNLYKKHKVHDIWLVFPIRIKHFSLMDFFRSLNLKKTIWRNEEKSMKMRRKCIKTAIMNVWVWSPDTKRYYVLGHVLCEECWDRPELQLCPECRVPLGNTKIQKYKNTKILKETLYEIRGNCDLIKSIMRTVSK